MHIELNCPSCNSFLSQIADTSMTILSQDLVHQAELQFMDVLSSLLFFHEIGVILIVITLY